MSLRGLRLVPRRFDMSDISDGVLLTGTPVMQLHSPFHIGLLLLNGFTA
jgi:hypothetical protein